MAADAVQDLLKDVMDKVVETAEAEAVQLLQNKTPHEAMKISGCLYHRRCVLSSGKSSHGSLYSLRTWRGPKAVKNVQPSDVLYTD